MIDLHMHTTYSDGTENCETVLKKCQQKNLDYISITDHNTALVYKELENKNVKDYIKNNSELCICQVSYRSVDWN